MPKSKPQAFLYPSAWDDFNRLTGAARREMIHAVDAIEKSPRLPASKRLTIPNETTEIRRYRLGHWRIIYVVVDEQPLVLAIRRRPPYDYEDLEELLKKL
ncbi:MAG: type II toxin-antitoxin system RelE/ParE family toxin [Anaerolineae bacterium CFX3]|nr:type II toxin-antitoxin system RelE/ParE family toxin [Anaerolineae bacterium CFX3]